jgi:hypothetical protein
MAALTAFVGIHVLILPVATFFAVNAALGVVWVVLALVIAREHRRLTGTFHV